MMDYGDTWRPDSCLPPSSISGRLEIVGESSPICPSPLPYPPTKVVPLAIENTGELSCEGDPDYDNIYNIYSRLDSDQEKGRVKIPTTCYCLVNKSPETNKDDKRPPTPTIESYCEIEEDSDEEDSVSLEPVLKMLERLNNKPLRKVANKAFLRIVRCLDHQKPVTEDQVKKLLKYLDGGPVEIQSLALSVMAQLCVGKENTQVLLEYGLVDLLKQALSSVRPLHPYAAAVKVLDNMVNHEDLIDDWFQPVSIEILPMMIQNLQVTEPSEYQLNVFCFFRTLSKYPEFSGTIQEDVIPVMDICALNSKSTRMKEVFTEVMMGAVTHTEAVSPEVICRGILPTAKSIIKQGPCGPQLQALSLLVTLTSQQTGVSAMSSDAEATQLVFCCIQESQCKKVQKEALAVLCNISANRRQGQCKDVMSHISDYLHPSAIVTEQPFLQVYSMGDQPIVPPIKNKYEKESQMWASLEETCAIVANVIKTEAKIEVNEKQQVTSLDFRPSGPKDPCPPFVSAITSCVQFLTNVCIWPISKSRHDIARVDLQNFSDTEAQKTKLSKVNRSLTQIVWDCCGNSIIAVLSRFSKRLKILVHVADMLKKTGSSSSLSQLSGLEQAIQGQRLLAEMAIAKNGAIKLHLIFKEEEMKLIKAILSFVLCVSICTCRSFVDLMSKEEISSTISSSFSDNVNGKSRKSESIISMYGKPPRPPSAKRERPCSASKKIDLDKSKAMEPEKHHKDLLDSTYSTDRRLLRKCLYEAGVFAAISPFIEATEADIQTMACQILRCNVQPLEEKVIPSNITRARPQSAVNRREVEKKINLALHKMSPETAEVFRNALGPRPLSAHPGPSAPRPQTAHPGPSSGSSSDSLSGSSYSIVINTGSSMVDDSSDESDDESLSQNRKTFTESDKTDVVTRISEYVKQVKIENKDKETKTGTMETGLDLPELNLHKTIAGQCREKCVEQCGSHMFSVLFSSPKETRKHCILLIQDIVHFGDVSVHMKMSEHGCVKRILDFLRVNTENEHLEIIGLIIVQMLIKSDSRLRYMFERHGGTRLLMMMTKHTSGRLRQEVTRTLKTFSKLAEIAKNKAIAEGKEGDVWDKIQNTWQNQDKVKNVLTQFYRQ